MSEDLIKIRMMIADRLYPMNVPDHHETVFREVGKLINEALKDFERTYDIRDKQDALAMLAIKLASEAAFSASEYRDKEQSVLKQVDRLCEQVDQML